jgi:hypothetical protein|tara:strand:+ start:4706 stop:5587 length:882 start_codon:yes stop_codon:yes gene_type:complete
MMKLSKCLLFFLFGLSVFGQNKREAMVPAFFNQSFQVSQLTSPLNNSLGATYVGDGRVFFVSDKAGIPMKLGTKFNLWSVDLITEKLKRVSTKNLCEINVLKYNVSGITVDDSNSFMIAALNDESFNDFLAVSRMTLLHIDLSHGFSQCAVPPFVKLGYTYSQPFYDDKSEYLYFVSDMPGGVGGLDIYRVKKNGVNEWGEVESLNEINTPNNEVYPFVNEDGRIYYSTLTASSGYDVYMYDFDKRSVPVRLKSPVNTKVDDFNFIIISEKDAVVARSAGGAQATILYRLLAF